MNKRKKIFIVVPIILIAFLLLIVGIYCVSEMSSKNYPLENKYRISDNVVEFSGTKTIMNDKLAEEHCLDDICVKDVAIYQYDNEGRIEYTIVNKGSNESSDILKLNFGDTYTYIGYSVLQPGKSVSSKTIFKKGDYSNVTDYTLEKLTTEERKNVNRQ